jgi:hypothetical protein
MTSVWRRNRPSRRAAASHASRHLAGEDREVQGDHSVRRRVGSNRLAEWTHRADHDVGFGDVPGLACSQVLDRRGASAVAIARRRLVASECSAIAHSRDSVAIRAPPAYSSSTARWTDRRQEERGDLRRFQAA